MQNKDKIFKKIKDPDKLFDTMDLNKSTVHFTSLYKFARKYPVLGRSTFSLHYFKNSVWFIKDFCKGNKSFSCSEDFSPVVRILPPLKEFFSWCEFFERATDFSLTNHAKHTTVKYGVYFYCWKENLFRLKNISKDGIKNV